MSYDLQIYGRVEGDVVKGLRKFLEGLSDLAAGRFSIDGPFDVEREDIPEVVLARTVAATTILQLSVPAAANSDIAVARKAAITIAEMIKGAVFDPQSEKVIWPRRASGHRAVTSATALLVDALEVEWFLPAGSAPSDFPAQFLRLVTAQVPEAVPRRFGSFEPFQGQLERDGITAFSDLCSDEGTVFWTCARPFVAGSISRLPRHPETNPLAVIAVRTKVLLSALSDQAWREEVVRLFRTTAEQLGAFYAHARVGRGYHGVRLSGGPETEVPLGVATVKGWLGLPIEPVWLAWFGEPYEKLLRATPLRPPFTRTSEHPDDATPLPVPEKMKIRVVPGKFGPDRQRAEVTPALPMRWE